MYKIKKQCHYPNGCVKLNGCRANRVKIGRWCQPLKLYRNAKCKFTKCIRKVDNVKNWKSIFNALHFDISRFPGKVRKK